MVQGKDLVGLVLDTHIQLSTVRVGKSGQCLQPADFLIVSLFQNPLEFSVYIFNIDSGNQFFYRHRVWHRPFEDFWCHYSR